MQRWRHLCRFDNFHTEKLRKKKSWSTIVDCLIPFYLVFDAFPWVFTKHSLLLLQITNPMLCEYFRQFGAIERVQILPERVNFMDLLPAALGTNATAQKPLTDRKYFAYVTFVNCLGAYDALNEKHHEIQNQVLHVEQAFSWHQPNSEITDVVEARAKANKTAAVNQVIFNALDKGLNDDCIMKIMSYLSLYELTEMAKYNHRFQLLAQTRRSLIITRDTEWPIDQSITLMNLRTILRLQGFGYTVTTLKLSLSMFSRQRQSVCSRLVHYCGPQLTSMSLLNSNINSTNFETLKPLLQQLHFLEIELCYDFDYSQFNDRWPKLRTLRVKSANSIALVNSASTNPTEFKNVTHLTLASTYKLDDHLFKTISTYFPAVIELAVIVNEDIYTGLTPLNPSNDLKYVRNLANLKRFHLTLSRTQLVDTTTNIIASLKGIEHFTLELNNNRSIMTASTQTVDNDNIMKKVKKIVEKLQQLKSLRLSGISFTDEKMIDLVQNATQLHTLSIHNSLFCLSEKLFNGLVSTVSQSKIKNNMVHNHGVLTLVVDQLSDTNMEEVSCLMSHIDFRISTWMSSFFFFFFFKIYS